MRDALDAVFPHWDGLAVAGRTDSGVHATGQVASVVVDGGPPADRVADALNAALPEDVAVRAADQRRTTSTLDSRARSRSYRYRVLVGRRSALEARRVLSWPHTVEAAALQAAASSRRRRARLPCLHADRDAVRGVRPKRVGGRVGARRGPARAHHHGGQLPPPHGARRSSGRCSRRGRRRPIESVSFSRVVPAPRPDSPRRRGASTSSGSTY